VNITDITIRRIYGDKGRLLGLASIVIDHDVMVYNVKIIQGDDRVFVAMPNHRGSDGIYRDLVHPLTPEARRELETAVLEKYREYLNLQEVCADVEEN